MTGPIYFNKITDNLDNGNITTTFKISYNTSTKKETIILCNYKYNIV